MYLDQALVGTIIGMSRESNSMSKNPPLTSGDEKSTNCSTSQVVQLLLPL